MLSYRLVLLFSDYAPSLSLYLCGPFALATLRIVLNNIVPVLEGAEKEIDSGSECVRERTENSVEECHCVRFFWVFFLPPSSSYDAERVCFICVYGVCALQLYIDK